MRRHQPRISNTQAALIALVAIAAAGWLVFGGPIPFQGSPYVVKAVFTSNTDLHIPSPVRIAGVDVGQVTGVRKLGDAGVVTMAIDSGGLPIHADATAQIRSRIFLEGNFYVDLHPGSPNAPILPSGGTLPAAATSGPVQLDRVLSSLDASARANLQTLVRGLGAALDASPPAGVAGGDEPPQDPSVRGLTGGQALGRSLDYSARAFEASAIVNRALLGTAPGDLTGVVAGTEQVFRGLAASATQLASLVTTLEKTVTALAARQAQLRDTIGVLPALLRATDAADTALNASYRPTRAFARAILPGLRQLDPTIGAALPWLAQLTALASRRELGGLLADLTPALKHTSESVGATRTLVGGGGAFANCLLRDVLPTGNEVIQDPAGEVGGSPITGEPVYQELFQSAVGLAGASGNFDGNGRYVRASVGGGSDQVQTGTLPVNGALYGNAVLAPLGTRPVYPGQAPPLRRSRACAANPAPNLNAAATGAGP